MNSTPEYNQEFIESHIKHLFKESWGFFIKEDDKMHKLFHCTVASSMKELAKNMELDIDFDSLELDIELDHISKEL